jgi:hypothetical protein
MTREFRSGRRVGIVIGIVVSMIGFIFGGTLVVVLAVT